jgi:hypothetical protein
MVQVLVGMATLLIAVAVAASLYVQSEQTKASVNLRILRTISVESKVDEVEALVRSNYQSLRSFQNKLSEVSGSTVRASPSAPKRALTVSEFGSIFQSGGQTIEREPEFVLQGVRFKMAIDVALETLPDAAIFPISADGAYHQLRVRATVQDVTNNRSYPEVNRVLAWW